MKNLEVYVDAFNVKYEMFRNGCDTIEEMKLWDKEAHGEMDVFYSNDMASIILRLIAADGKITEREVEYLNKTFDFGYTQEELEEVYKNSKENLEEFFDESFENGITLMRKINSGLADTYKELLAAICEIIINSDGVVALPETIQLEKLKEMCASN